MSDGGFDGGSYGNAAGGPVFWGTLAAAFFVLSVVMLFVRGWEVGLGCLAFTAFLALMAFFKSKLPKDRR